jgi:hypothetical protein
MSTNNLFESMRCLFKAFFAKVTYRHLGRWDSAVNSALRKHRESGRRQRNGPEKGGHRLVVG